MASLADIPFYGAYKQVEAANRAAGTQDLQQMGALQGILANVEAQKAKQVALQKEQAFRGELEQLGPNATQEQLAQVAAKYSPAKDILTSQTSSLDRKAALEAANVNRDAAREQARELQADRLAQQAELARQRSEDQRLSQADRNQARMDMIRLSASLRPAPAQQPLQSIVGDDGKPTLVPREQAIGKTPWTGSPDQLALKVTGGRESVYVQRMMMGANQASKDLANVVQLPLSASTGIFGGRKQGAGLLDATKEILANKATGQEAQAYNAMATGFQRSLAQIESAGLMPSGSLTHQMDAVLFKEGDTNATKMHKLAQTRQIVEAGMEVIESNPRVSPEEKAKVKGVLDSIRKSVPFTHSDLIRLQVEQEKNPAATLKDVLGPGPAGGGTGKWSIKPR